MKSIGRKPLLAIIGLALFAQSAFGHILEPSTHNLLTGSTHSFWSWDHILAMVVIGVWATKLTGARGWKIAGTLVTRLLPVIGITAGRLLSRITVRKSKGA